MSINKYIPVLHNTYSHPIFYITLVRSARGSTEDGTSLANSLGLIVTLFVTSCVLYMPTRRSASSNILFRSETIINWAFFVLS